MNAPTPNGDSRRRRAGGPNGASGDRPTGSPDQTALTRRRSQLPHGLDVTSRSPSQGFVPGAPAGADYAPPPLSMRAPALSPRPNDGSSMDLRLYGRVMWRFKWIMALGLILGTLGAYALYTGVGGATYASKAQVFITQQGFTWGAAARAASQTGTGNASSATASSANVSPYVPGVDPQRLSSLASLYAQLAAGSALRNMLPAGYREMLNPASGSPTARLSANAVAAAEYATPAILPLVTFWASGPTPRVATGLAAAATSAFERLLTQQQAAVAPTSRVVGQIVQTATPGRLSSHKSKSLPIMVFLLGVLGAFGTSLALENARPRGVRRKRRLLRRKRASAPAEEMPADGDSAWDERAGGRFADANA